MQADYQAAITRYNKCSDVVLAFESRYLNNAALIIQTANSQLAAGTINYLEWAQVTNQAITIKNEYADAVRNLNEAIIQINFLTTK